MKRIFFIMVIPILLSAVNVGQSAPATVPVNGGYDPKAFYEGVYEKDRIYKKRTSVDFWKGNKKPAKVYTVKCSSAFQNLSTAGTWIGNLREDGSCGSTMEPAEWALGNYLNFLAGTDSAQ